MTHNPILLDARRRRILWRASHRGMKEVDLILGCYARREVAAMDEAALVAFEALLTETDTDLYDWLVRGGTPTHTSGHELIDALRKIRFRTDGYGQP